MRTAFAVEPGNEWLPGKHVNEQRSSVTQAGKVKSRGKVERRGSASRPADYAVRHFSFSNGRTISINVLPSHVFGLDMFQCALFVKWTKSHGSC